MIKTELIDLGTLNYRDAWAKQQLLLERLKEEKRLGKSSINYLLLVEHPHVYTIGRNGDMQNMLIDAIQLKAKNAEFIKVDRGGDITYHGYGQLVVYPVIRLDMFETGIKEYIYRLEEVVIRTAGTYGIKCGRIKGAIGVWLDAGTQAARKICAIGVRCSGFVTMHGLALNVNTDLNYFSYINPCGFVDKGVTSIEKEIRHKVDFDEIKALMVQNFSEIFGMEFVYTNTLTNNIK
ncbi:MAG: lipoyl(octanoyl) transferase LipB [Prevotellaceae bacterium]|jgi:lipoyl(octanoyl) transferase|nr:lipoyl(octanoyl) transferase LipB [Prevotellaceae bacterium]